MGQIRLYYTANKKNAETYFPLMEQEFEDDGLSLSMSEIDEIKEIYELSIYCEESDTDSITTRFMQILNVTQNKIMREILPDIDWVRHSLAELKPVQAGHFFVHGHHDRDKVKPDDIAIEIEAGLAFGTGHHGTTAGCLEMISEVMQEKEPKNALDLGTGSGVLAIAIAKLAKLAKRDNIKILATDIDQIAVNVAIENFTLNNVANSIDAITATGFDHEGIIKRAPFDLIVANILANPLMELAPQLVQSLSKNGSVILSGILEEQHDRVLDAYKKQGVSHIKTFHREGWVTILLRYI